MSIGPEIAKMTFRTPPMNESTGFTGPIGLTRYAAIDATDTTWMARLYDVATTDC